MIVYPLNIHLGPLEITGYGIMMAVGFLMAGWAVQISLRDRGLNPDFAADMVVGAVIGGIVGAKLWYVALTGDPAAIFSRAGLVWYGGLVGGMMALAFVGWRKRVPFRLTSELAAPALAMGYGLGRVGCFLVGDDYGRPTDFAWGVKFPEGLPPTTVQSLQQQFGVTPPAGSLPTDLVAVHATQLYEAAVMLALFAILWRLRRHSHATGWLFGLYLVLAGLERFSIEFLRVKDDRFFGPLTLAQFTALGFVLVGLWLLARLRSPDRAPPAEAPALAMGGAKAA
jgi:phosphatidylglycerol:prolipoprotein diacylglycerol transferase